MPFYKNTASQNITIYAYDKTTGLPKTGDAANITAYLSKDCGTPAPTNAAHPTEEDATNHKGFYHFPMLQAETNANMLSLSPVSATSNILIDPVEINTVASVDQTGDSFINVNKLAFDLVSAVNYLKVTNYGFMGNILAGTAAYIVGAFNNFFNIQTPTGTVNSLPSATPNATGGLAIVGSKVDLVDAPNTTAIAAFKTGLAGLGTYMTGIMSTALTETSGLLAAGFKKFFNVATPTGTVNSLPDAVAGATSGLAIVGSQQDLVNAPNATAVTAIQAGLLTEDTFLNTNI